jgi:hypothetical protein
VLAEPTSVCVGRKQVVGKVLVDPTSVCVECELMLGCVSADPTSGGKTFTGWTYVSLCGLEVGVRESVSRSYVSMCGM